MNNTFYDDLHTYVEDTTGVPVPDLAAGDSPADRRLVAALDRAATAAAKITKGKVDPAAPTGLRYARIHTDAIVRETDRWIADTLGHKGFGSA